MNDRLLCGISGCKKTFNNTKTLATHRKKSHFPIDPLLTTLTHSAATSSLSTTTSSLSTATSSLSTATPIIATATSSLATAKSTNKTSLHAASSTTSKLKIIFLPSAVNTPSSPTSSFPSYDQPLKCFRENISNFLNTHKKNFIISLININSLQKKFSEIYFLLKNQLLDILVINETKLNSLDDDNQFENSHYRMIRRDRKELGHGGGIMVFIKRTINIVSVDIDTSKEIISFIFKPDESTNIGLIAGYRPPHNENSTAFLAAIESKSNEFENLTKETIIVGDFNYNMFVKENNKLEEFITSSGFNNTINKGTRLNPTTKALTLLDVILCLFLNFLIASKVFPFPLSDHLFVVSAFNFKKPKTSQNIRSNRFLSKEKISLIKIRLSSLLSNFNFNANDVDTQWNLIKDIMVSCIDSIAPLKSISVKSFNNMPWIDKEFVMMAKKRDSLYARAIRNKNLTQIWEQFKAFRKKCALLYSKNKAIYYNNFINNNSSSSKKFWKKLKPFISPNKKPKIISQLILNKTTSNSDLNLATTFCNYFSTAINIFNFLPLSICLDFIKNFLGPEPSAQVMDGGFGIDEFNLEEVVNSLKNLPLNSEPGEVGIEAAIFVNCAEEIGPAITNLFNLILKTNKFPTSWKCSHIRPNYKGKGLKSTISNYRPISTISPISKIFETLFSNYLVRHLESNELLHPSQFGFRKGSSCELALNTLIEGWRDSLDKNLDVMAVYLDLSKAFDTVDHNILAFKLQYFNLNQKTIDLIKSYLMNRTIKVIVNDSISKPQPLNVGVPQGSILGPILFLIYINDIFNLNLSSDILLFADDTTISLGGSGIDLVCKKITQDLNEINTWLNHNRLLLNIEKTQAMHFKPKNKSNKNNPELKCNNLPIKFVDSAKLLGVIIDNKLRFDLHSISVCKKVNARTFLLTKSLYIFSLNFRPILFKLFILPNFDYCSTIFTHHSNKIYFDKLNKTFNKSIFKLTKINLFNKTLEEQYHLLKGVNILPLAHRNFFMFCNFIYNVISPKSLQTNTKTKLAKKFQYNNNCTRNLFSHPHFFTNFKLYSFITIATKILNKFLAVETYLNQNLFKNNIKKNILLFFKDTVEFWT